MTKTFYVDTSVWRDYFEDRQDSIRPLGELAATFLRECRARGCKILYSDLVVSELLGEYSMEELQARFSDFADYLVKVDLLPEHRLEAKRLSLERKESHQADITHALIARDHGAVMVTRDWGFGCLRDLVEVRKPEEVTFE